jgi:hypothetical protein
MRGIARASVAGASGGKYRFVEPHGRLLGLDYHLGECEREVRRVLVPVFRAD